MDYQASLRLCILLHPTGAAAGILLRPGGLTIKTVINKSQRPVKIALPRGKTLHLGPGGQGRVHDDALERPANKKLIEAGQVEILSDDGHSTGPSAGADKVSGPSNRSTRGHATTKTVAGKGDR